MPSSAYKNAVKASIGTTPVQLCAAASGKQLVVQRITLVNVTGGAVLVDVTLTDNSASVTAHVSAAAQSIAAGARADLNGPFVLESLDSISIVSDTAASIDATAGLQEITP